MKKKLAIFLSVSAVFILSICYIYYILSRPNINDITPYWKIVAEK